MVRGLETATSDEHGVHFETGVSVTFRYVRNTESAANFGSRFGQDIEPAGRYLLHGDPGHAPRGWESGTVTFRNPLVIPLSGDPEAIYGPTGWKARLRDATGLSGRALSRHLVSLGYDGIVTVDADGYTREIVDMTGLVKNPSFEEEINELRSGHATRKAEILAALAPTGGIIVTHKGGSRELLIRSPEMSGGKNPLRLTTFGVDGPWGHSEFKSDDEIASELAYRHFASVQPASDDYVIAWTSTPEFKRGSLMVTHMQASNALRYWAAKHDVKSAEWKQASAILERANDMIDAGDIEDATSMVAAELHKLTKMHYVENPGWVTRVLAKSYQTVADQVPPAWLPKLSDVKSWRGKVSGKLKEYGCGAYGCVLPTLDSSIVLKVTTDDTEAEFAAKFADDLVAPIVVMYHTVMRTSARHNGRPIYLLWRESAESVGKLGEELGAGAENLINRQHSAAKEIVKLAMMSDSDPDAIADWLETCREIALQKRYPEIKALGAGLAQVFQEQGILIGDVHAGNVGKVNRAGAPAWVITDPGNVLVFGAQERAAVPAIPRRTSRVPARF